ncbi:MAG: hypothetical protein HKN03_05215 [Acidimicrobiales bacterium]|nr:hypothetical protein [Acidimicrobiales bacterium]
MARTRASASSREVLSTLAFCAVCFALIAALAVLPARTWWTQRQALNAAQEHRAELLNQRAQLDSQLGKLQTDAEVERLARANYDLVFPGEESFRILPAGE